MLLRYNRKIYNVDVLAAGLGDPLERHELPGDAEFRDMRSLVEILAPDLEAVGDEAMRKEWEFSEIVDRSRNMGYLRMPRFGMANSRRICSTTKAISQPQVGRSSVSC
jgi:hypothetical protein